MPRGRVLKGALEGFLGTYTSRYSDVDGYWLFGLLLDALGDLEVNLMEPAPSKAATPTEWAVMYARQRFLDQVGKSGLPAARIVRAQLTIKRLAGSEEGRVNGHVRSGARLEFVAEAALDTGASFDVRRDLFVAPHDPAIELRSTRAA